MVIINLIYFRMTTTAPEEDRTDAQQAREHAFAASMVEMELMDVESSERLAGRLHEGGVANPQLCEALATVWKHNSPGGNITPMFDKEAIHLKEMRGFVKTVRCIADRIEFWSLK